MFLFLDGRFSRCYSGNSSSSIISTNRRVFLLSSIWDICDATVFFNISVLVIIGCLLVPNSGAGLLSLDNSIGFPFRVTFVRNFRDFRVCDTHSTFYLNFHSAKIYVSSFSPSCWLSMPYNSNNQSDFMIYFFYTGSAKFMATHILTWFSNKNEKNWIFTAAAYSQITCKSIHL